MWAREQSYSYLRQYIRAKDVAPWVVGMYPGIEQRARENLQHLGGLGSSWDIRRSDCTYYYPQRNQDVKTHQG
jgi:hypothetical protein